MFRLARLLLLLTMASPEALAGTDSLRFRRGGHEVEILSRERIVEECGVQKVTLDDPYYKKRKTYFAAPLGCVLRLGFASGPEEWGETEVLFRARDGYARPVAATQLTEPGSFLALADAELGGLEDSSWAPIGREQTDPAPYYLVWTGGDQNDPHRHPWPYQLAVIEIVSLDQEYPRLLPSGMPTQAAAWRGYEIFRRDCLTCHAINGDGGRVGPELNVPQSIVAYRDPIQLKAFIRDPEAFRYTRMPANPHLSDADLEALIAYFEAMRTRKHDPRGAK